MIPSPGNKPAGIVGCLDPGDSSWRRLAHWTGEHGAATWCEDGGFRLWGPGAGMQRVHRIDAPGLCGVLCGDLFEPPPDATGPNAKPADQLVQAYRRAGPDCLFQLNGQISLFLWDAKHRELILFRDDSGSGTVYFSELPHGGLVFASDLDLLAASPLIDKQLSRQSVHEFLRFLDVSPPNSIYEGISSAEPGVLYRVGETLIRQRPPQAAVDTRRSLPLRQAAEELQELLTRAVAVRLGAEGTTVTFLSGGVDSSLIAMSAAARESSRVAAVTVGFEQSGFDESPVAGNVAAHLKVPHRVLAFPMSDYLGAFEELAAGIQYPSADPAGVPTYLAFKAARDIGAIALDGTGADTLFGVMPARHQRLAVEYGALLPLPARRLAARGLQTVPQLRRYAPLVDFDDPEEILIRWRGWSRSDLEDLCDEPVSFEHTRFYQIFRQFPRGDHLERYSALIGNLPDDRVHQASALTGLQVRFPYFDPRLCAWVRNLELGLRYDPAEPKRVLKALLAHHVPRELWDQPKHGFDFPFLHLLTFDDCALVRKYLDPAITEHWNLFDQEKVQVARDAFFQDDRRSAFATQSPAFRTWALVVLFAWLENHYRHL
jgi:asparagine synthase (glutamine-hydrolysing)